MATKKSHGRSHGFKHKSRSIMTKKSPRGVSFLLREYVEGQNALVIIDPRQHKGLPHRRYHGKVGVITNIVRDPGQPFARVTVAPTAQLDRSRNLLLVF